MAKGCCITFDVYLSVYLLARGSDHQMTCFWRRIYQLHCGLGMTVKHMVETRESWRKQIRLICSTQPVYISNALVNKLAPFLLCSNDVKM